MGIALQDVVPWGRSRSEYIRMFNLTEAELKRSLLDCGGGPASFTAETIQAGGRVIACDPIYRFSESEIAQRIQETYPVVLEATKAAQEQFIWREITSIEHLGQVRMASMQKFLADFPAGKQAGRYVSDELPKLSFATGQFDLALCSHLLFTYSAQLTYEFHLASILELCRVAREVRVFPLLTGFEGERSPHLQPVLSELDRQGYAVKIERVAYEFQRNGNQMLRIQVR